MKLFLTLTSIIFILLITFSSAVEVIPVDPTIQSQIASINANIKSLQVTQSQLIVSIKDKTNKSDIDSSFQKNYCKTLYFE